MLPDFVSQHLRDGSITDLDLAYWCRLVYDAPETIEKAIPNDIEMVFLTDSDTDAEALAVSYSKTLILIFRGTESIQDWMQNMPTYLKTFFLTSSRVRSEAAKIHKGFLNCWNGNRSLYRLYKPQKRSFFRWWVNPERDVPGIEDNLNKRVNLDKYSKIYTTGHSLGGAVASIAAVALSAKGRPVIKLVTFGSPRVGNELWKRQAEIMVKNIRRYVFQTDIVTIVPTALLPFRSYRHIGELNFISQQHFPDSPGIVLKKNLTFWQEKWERLRIRFDCLLRGNPFVGIAHHHIDCYIQGLTALKQSL